jgi:hypothetical protein
VARFHDYFAELPGVIETENCKGKGLPYNRPSGPKRGSRGIALSFRELRHEERMGWLAPRPGRMPPGKRPGTHCTGGWVGLRAGLDGCGKSRLHRDSIPGPSSRSESLYRLHYPGPQLEIVFTLFSVWLARLVEALLQKLQDRGFDSR